jgi:hypothetical protein
MPKNVPPQKLEVDDLVLVMQKVRQSPPPKTVLLQHQMAQSQDPPSSDDITTILQLKSDG